jgi:hypothetical protein
MAKYESVNGQWPEGTNDGRDIIPTPEEAMSGAKRLYRVALGKPFKGEMKLTSGRRRTWIRRHVFYVNPNEKRGWSSINGGWHEIVHSVSHMASWRLHRENHGPRHAWIEKQLIAHVVRSGWLDGKLKRKPREAKPPVDPKAEKLTGIEARIKRWQAKQKRATTALRKLERQRKYYERQAAQKEAAPEMRTGPL